MMLNPHLFNDLQSHRTLAGEDVGVVEPVDVEQALLLADLERPLPVKDKDGRRL